MFRFGKTSPSQHLCVEGLLEPPNAPNVHKDKEARPRHLHFCRHFSYHLFLAVITTNVVSHVWYLYAHFGSATSKLFALSNGA